MMLVTRENDSHLKESHRMDVKVKWKSLKIPIGIRNLLMLNNSNAPFVMMNFGQQVDLARHVYHLHTLPYPYYCGICGLSYTATRLVHWNHVRVHHAGEIPLRQGRTMAELRDHAAELTRMMIANEAFPYAVEA